MVILNSKMKELKIKMLLVHVTQNCNSPCVMCDCWKTKGKVQLEINDLAKTVDIFSKNGGELVMISGGEPTLHKNINEILSFCKSKDLKIAFNTNGILLHNKIQQIAKDCDFIVISIDAAQSELYAKIRGVNAFDKVVSNIKAVQRDFPNIKIQFRCTISRLNLFSFVNVIELADNLNISGVGFSPIDFDSVSFSRVENELNDNLELLIPSEEEIETFHSLLKGEIGQQLENYFDRRVITWNLEYFFELINYFKTIRSNKENKLQGSPCFFPYTSVLVDYDGSLRGCFYSKPFSNIYDVTEDNFLNYGRIQDISKENICFNCRGKIFT